VRQLNNRECQLADEKEQVERSPRMTILNIQPLAFLSGIDLHDIADAVRVVNEAEVIGPEREVVFSQDEESKRTVLRIIDRATGQVIGQAPREHILRLARQAARKARKYA
jgi:hypothetical protein